MFEKILVFISGAIIWFITKAGYVGLFFLAMISTVNIPIPSEVIFPFAGFLVFYGKFNIFLVVAIGTLGCFLGSIISYKFANVIISFREKSLFLKVLFPESRLLKVNSWFNKYGPFAVFFAMIMPVFRAFISLPAGIAKMNFKKFMIFSFAGNLIWVSSLSVFGMFFGNNWKYVESYFSKFAWVIVAIIMIALVFWSYKHIAIIIKKKNI